MATETQRTRLRKLVGESGGQSAFARLVWGDADKHKGKVRRWLKEKTNVSADQAAEICYKVTPRRSVQWLLTGRGPEIEATELGASFPPRGEAAQRLRVAVIAAVRKELGSLYPIAVGGIDEMTLVAVPVVADTMRMAGDKHGENDHSRYLKAASSLGRAVVGALQTLGIDPADWPETVKAQYVLQTMAALLVPLDLEYVHAIPERGPPASTKRKPSKRGRLARRKPDTKRT
jgi:hypothetical protein